MKNRDRMERIVSMKAASTEEARLLAESLNKKLSDNTLYVAIQEGDEVELWWVRSRSLRNALLESVGSIESMWS